MRDYGWTPYVSVAERRSQAEKAALKATKSGSGFSPVVASRGAIAKTFWGKAWCDNLEAYSDYASRLPRGRSYMRNGSVVDLQISQGEVWAQVMGTSLYQVTVKVAPVPQTQWQVIGTDCAGSIDSLVELLQGKLSSAVMQRICKPKTGLFPAPKELSFSCSCPDWALMCKHVAAVLYGVGARLDERPELLFSLRGVDAKNLVSQAGAGLPKSAAGPAPGKLLDQSMLADVFGIEMDEAPAATKLARPRKQAAPVKTLAKKPTKAKVAPAAQTKKKPASSRTVAATTKPSAVKKPAIVKAAASKKAPAKKAASPAKPAPQKSPAIKVKSKATPKVALAAARKKPAKKQLV